MMRVYKPPICHLCGGALARSSMRRLHGQHTKFDRPIQICRQCGAYVTLHKDTGRPMGIVATKEGRALRQQCHQLFDARWKDAKDSRNARIRTYAWLAKVLNLPANYTHFAHFGPSTLERIKKILTAVQGYQLKDIAAEHGYKTMLPASIDRIGMDNILYINEGVTAPGTYILLYKKVRKDE